MARTTWTVPATVVRVVDGDTVRLKLDLGWHLELATNCRILGIDAPEVTSAPGLRAKSHAADLLPVGADVTFISRQLDKYGRPLGALICADWRDFATLMLNAGHAASAP